MKSNAFVVYDMYNLIAVTMKGQKHETLSQKLQITSQLDLEAEKNLLKNPGIFKATGNNAIKRWKMNQGTAVNNQSQKISRGYHQADSYLEILSEEKANAGIKTNCYAKVDI